MAATVALVQTDIKKVLAYSTVSQLGYMFLACGLGAFGVGVFHLFTHAFFKALLFLGSGSVIHALSGEQDMRRMGGLARKIPWTFWTFVVGTVAIAGVPPFAGFFSKDAILEAAWEHHQPLLFTVALLTAVLTAFYMTRLVCLTFLGEYRGTLETEGSHAHADDHGHEGAGGIHESPSSMLLPLLVLAVGSAVAGFIPIPALVADAVGAPEAHESAGFFTTPGLLALGGALAGIALAYLFYVRRPELPGQVAARLSTLRRVFEAKWGFDDLGNWIARRLVVDGSREVLWMRVDASLIDGAVNGSAAAAAALAQSSRSVQSGRIRGYVLLILGGAVALIAYLLSAVR
jgi:NADH-quinone oxidoreductase subunit L